MNQGVTRQPRHRVCFPQHVEDTPSAAAGFHWLCDVIMRGPFSLSHEPSMLDPRNQSTCTDTSDNKVELSQPTPMTETQSLPATEVFFVSPGELAALLRVSIDCIYRLAAKRILPAYRVLRRILFRRSDVERWLAAHRTDPRDPDLWQ